MRPSAQYEAQPQYEAPGPQYEAPGPQYEAPGPQYEAQPQYRSPSGDAPRYDYDSGEDTFGYYDHNEPASYGEAAGRHQPGRVNGRGRREGPCHGGGLGEQAGYDGRRNLGFGGHEPAEAPG